MRKTPAWRRCAPWFAALWLGCQAHLALAQTPDSAEGITQHFTSITLERDCFGCASGVKLVLQREGLATRTQMGKARLGTRDDVRSSPLRSADFDAVLRVILGQGFMALQARYEDADLRDGHWLVLSLRGPQGEKSVFQREQAGPPSLQAMLSALEALEAQLFKTTH